ncbi:MAG: SDR family oxidoreductase [Thermoanaerobaculia bacterium]
MDLGLKGKVAMVAGASRGLGFAVARALAGEGAIVSISSRQAGAIEAAAAKIHSETDAQILAVAADVRNARSVEAWRNETLARFGRLDLLFTNSGGPPAGKFEEFDDAAWQNAFELLVLSVVRMVRLAIPPMRKGGGGSIVVSTSSSVKEPIPNLVLSTALRASAASLAKTLALELAPDRIRVNHLIPGRLATDRVRELDEINAKKAGVPLAEQQRRAASAIPLGRYGEPAEFGRAAAFLLSDAASYLTGATLQVDGGAIHSVL